jgi:hypothetical protein
VTSFFRHEVVQIRILVLYYIVSSDNPVPTFRDNLSVPPSKVKKSKKKAGGEEEGFLGVSSFEDGTDRSS